LSTLLALCRQEAPQVNIRLSEMPIAQLVHGLNSDLFDAGFAMIDDVGAGIIATPVWVDPLMVALSARHPLLVFKEVPLEEVVRYPLVLCDPQAVKVAAGSANAYSGHSMCGRWWPSTSRPIP
jgi:DNA-binding transcriptional LysR family regulator